MKADSRTVLPINTLHGRFDVSSRCGMGKYT